MKQHSTQISNHNSDSIHLPKQESELLINNEHYQLVDMPFITHLIGVTNKWIYSLIKRGEFPKPIKLGRASRWRLSEIKKWIDEKEKESQI